jgi:hypothetical protein
MGRYFFSDLVIALREHGFELYTLVNEPDQDRRSYDCVFIPQHSPLFGKAAY